jgi:Tfp pilus assembly protein PilF
MRGFKDWLRFVPLSLSTCGAILASSGCNQFPSVLSSPREEAQAKIHAARMHESRGQEEQAETLYRAALSQDGRSVDAHRRLALLAAKNRRWDEADQHFRAALKLHPGDSRILADYGYLLYRQDRLLEAERSTRVALEGDPDNPRIINNLAMIVGRQGRYQESLTLFRQAGNEAQAQNNIAYLYAQRGEYELAEVAYVRSIELDGKNRAAGLALVQLCDSRSPRAVDSQSPLNPARGDALTEESSRYTARNANTPAVRNTSHTPTALTQEVAVEPSISEVKPVARTIAAEPRPAEINCAAPSVAVQPSIRSRQMAEQSTPQPLPTVSATLSVVPSAPVPAPVVAVPTKTLPSQPSAAATTRQTPSFSAPQRPAAPVAITPALVAPVVPTPTANPAKVATVPTPSPVPAPTPLVAPVPQPVVATPQPAADVPKPIAAKPPVVILPKTAAALNEKEKLEKPRAVVRDEAPVTLPESVPVKAADPKPIVVEQATELDNSSDELPLPALKPVQRKQEEEDLSLPTPVLKVPIQVPAPAPVIVPAPAPNLLRLGPSAASKPRPVTPVITPAPTQSPVAQPELSPRPAPTATPQDSDPEYPTFRIREQSKKRDVPAPKMSRADKPEKAVPKKSAPEVTELQEEDIAQLAELLNHGKPEEREAAATALGEFGPLAAPAVPALIEALVDSNRGIRRAAGIALEKIGNSTRVEDDGKVIPASELQLIPVSPAKPAASNP